MLIFTIGICHLVHGQATVKYLNDLSVLAPEVPMEEALYSRTTTGYYGDITFEDFDLKKNKLISRKTYRSGEPYGKWILTIGNKRVELDYTFNSTYIKSRDEICNDSILIKKIGKNLLADNQDHHYTAPRLVSGADVYNFIRKELIYPPDALTYGFSGQVYVRFEIDTEGKVHNVKMVKGKEKHIDMEAQRVVRSLSFAGPAPLEGNPVSLCLLLPITFTIN